MNETTTAVDVTLSTAQIVPLGVYCFGATVVGLLGNALVIYSSVVHNAIRLDEVSLLLIQNLAVADIFYTLLRILPTTITYIARKYVLGGLQLHIIIFRNIWFFAKLFKPII